jgi:hypothetical protein
MNATQRTIGITVASLALVITPGCNDPGSGALTGAGVGAGIGALIGSATGHAGQGAIIGALLGGYTGAVIGKINEDQRRELQRTQQGQHAYYIVEYNDSYYAHQPPPPPPVYIVQPAPYVVQPAPYVVEQAPQSYPAGQPQPAPAVVQPPPTPAPPAPPPTSGPAPLSVDDIKALSTAGVKPDVINNEIDQSKAVYSPQDIATAQQANVDATVIQHMQKTAG